MGEFISKNIDNSIYFDTITKDAFKKLKALDAKLPAYTFKYLGRKNSSIAYYDTPENLLQRTGILLYKTCIDGKHYFNLSKQPFLPNAFRKSEEKVFVHEISQRDTPKDHALYLVDAISSMFTTQFRIDLENVLKTARPKLIIEIKSEAYKVFGGTGFKCDMDMQNVLYNNLETKRKVKRKEVAFKLDSSTAFQKDYDLFIKTITKYCKDIAEMKEPRDVYALNLTKQLDKTGKKDNIVAKKKEKQRRPEDIIEG